MASSTFDVATVRGHFPALGKEQIYLDNAGGSQCLKEVAESVSTYLLASNVQLGASYPVSQEATKLYTAGTLAVADYINAPHDCVVLGASTTQLFRNLSLSLWDHITPASEIIVSKVDHEANIASWEQFAALRSCTLKWWTPTPSANPHLTAADLRALLTPATRLVACTHTSNILGSITDIPALAAEVHRIPGALLCVDAVAFAPHRAVDVAALGVDFYCFSWYKVYGPHVAALYASREAQATLRSLGHFFKGSDSLEDKLGLAGASYELVAGIPPVCAYLAGMQWEEIARYEEELQGAVLGYLRRRPEVFRVLGVPEADRRKRVPVISFVVQGRSSKDVVEAMEKKSRLGCRWGAFYSNRLVKDVLGLDPADGVVRVSLVHYNTMDEVQTFIRVLDEVLQS